MTTMAASADLARYRLFFLVAAVYDMALGVAFFFLYQPIFEWLGMTLPPHVSYIHLPAVFVFVQGLSYLIAYANPLGNLGIVKVGVAYKGSYTALAAYYLVTDQIPAMFFAWFGLFDFFFFIGFVWFLRWAGRGATSS
jgi:hypothetical protein